MGIGSPTIMMAGTNPYFFSEAMCRMGLNIVSDYLKEYTKLILEGTRSFINLRRDHRQEKVIFMEQSIAFVSGSGLTVAIEQFGLPVNAEQFRETYFDWLEWQKRKQSS